MLFVIVTESALNSCMYADDLMMEDQEKIVWKPGAEVKGLKMNAEETKLHSFINSVVVRYTTKVG